VVWVTPSGMCFPNRRGNSLKKRKSEDGGKVFVNQRQGRRERGKNGWLVRSTGEGFFMAGKADVGEKMAKSGGGRGGGEREWEVHRRWRKDKCETGRKMG